MIESHEKQHTSPTERTKQTPTTTTMPTKKKKHNDHAANPMRRTSSYDIGGHRSHVRRNSFNSISLSPSQIELQETTRQPRSMRGADKNVFCARRRGLVRVWMFQSDEGAAWDVWIMLLCLLSVLVFVVQTYIEGSDSVGDEGKSSNSTAVLAAESMVSSIFMKIDDPRVYTSTVVAEFICAVFFTMDLCLNLFAARSPIAYLLCSWGLVDLVTCIPVYVELSVKGFAGDPGDASLVSILTLLRFARVFKVTRFLRELRLQRMLKTRVAPMTSKIISSVIVIAAIWLLFSSLVYVAEVEIPMYFYRLARLAAINQKASNITDPSIPPLVPFKKTLSFGEVSYIPQLSPI